MNGRVAVVDDVATAFVDVVVETFTQRIDHDFTIAFSGGDTARRCYESLAGSRGVDWTRVRALWGDERCVPLDDPDSNHRLAHEVLLDRVGPTLGDHPLACTDRAIAQYAELVRSTPIDLVHLGLGPDGHTASLFAGSTALHAPPGILVMRNEDPTGRNPHTRATLTLDAIARARAVVVTVAGSGKREAFARVRAGDTTAPAALLRCDELVWLVDRAAFGEEPDTRAPKGHR